MSLSSLPYSKLNPATSDIFFGVSLKWVHCLALKHMTLVALEKLLIPKIVEVYVCAATKITFHGNTMQLKYELYFLILIN